ncbi:sensor histidine kinase [Acinetobacter sp. MD2]|uniref:sensor histidine kinase n=1 Tax=Acinetobacter sp. MD2 TaxID=2600066 RepID=UPI002D1F61D9|nr:ATP-binding protein [Acinetobacter sp. MD2]MEB3767862.1 HAMP domain-containing histidine kinase [Acinetobacter sp. MD2]
MNHTKSHSLWRWFSLRILSLAIGSIVLIGLCMWLRYYLLNWWVLRQMPVATQQEFLYLRHHSGTDSPRFHYLVDTWFGPAFSDPSINSTDWTLLGILVIVVIPVMVIFGLRAARPLALQFSHLAQAAQSVSEGQFSVVAPQEKAAPEELLQLTHDFNTMAQQLARYEKELRHSHVALAHELRSPLTAAIGRLQGMRDGVFPLEPQQLDLLMRQMQHLNQLIGDLHFLSLVDANQLSLNLQACCLHDILAERMNWLQPDCLQSDFVIHNAINPALYVNADPFRLGQLISILLENSLRYAAEGKKMSIQSIETFNEVTLEFRDYGAGVSEEFLLQIFQRFTRAEHSRARHSGGSGLGLSIAKAIAEAHQGSLSVKNHPEGGLLFRLSLNKNSEKK